MRSKKGFTLIELLVVIGILAVLLAITLIAINPAQQLNRSNDIKRQSDINAILNAVNQYMIDNAGTIPTGIGATATIIGDGVGEADLCDLLVPDYIAAIPQDPGSNNGADIDNCGVTYDSGYSISTSNGRIVVSAVDSNGQTIQVMR